MTTTRIPIEYWHEALLCRNLKYQMMAQLPHVAAPVPVLGIRRVGTSNFEVLSDVGGWQRAVEVWTEKRPKVEVGAEQEALFT